MAACSNHIDLLIPHGKWGRPSCVVMGKGRVVEWSGEAPDSGDRPRPSSGVATLKVDVAVDPSRRGWAGLPGYLSDKKAYVQTRMNYKFVLLLLKITSIQSLWSSGKFLGDEMICGKSCMSFLTCQCEEDQFGCRSP